MTRVTCFSRANRSSICSSGSIFGSFSPNRRSITPPALVFFCLALIKAFFLYPTLTMKLLKNRTFCSPNALLIPGLPAFPLTFLPKTSCFDRVNFAPKTLNCPSICFNFAVLSGSFSENVRFFLFPVVGRVTLASESLNRRSCEPFLPMSLPPGAVRRNRK